jgi:predicted Zn-dependent protease
VSGLPPAHDVVEEILDRAGGDRVALVEETHDAEVRFAKNTITTNGVRVDRRVSVVAMCPVDGGWAAGTASRGGDVDTSDLVAAAEHDARTGSSAEDASPLLSGDADPAFALPPGHTDLSVLSGILASLAKAFTRAESNDTVLSGYAEHQVATAYLGTSTGLRLRHLQPTGALHLVGRSRDGARSAWAGSGTADFSDVVLESLEARVTRGLDWARRRVELAPGRYEVILPPDATADLMVALADAAGGREAEEGRTVFSAPGGRTRIGDVLSTLPFELWSDPVAEGLECVPFLATAASSSDVSVFDNGLSVGRVGWIEGGRLGRLRYHRAGAARSGSEVTPPVDNLVLDLPGAGSSVDDMVARTERGLLLTCLWYIREVDPTTLLLTGLTRDGVYVVEDGRVVGSANNFRFNESPVDLLARSTEAGASVRALGREFGEWVNRTRMPALRIPDFNMSSVSPAN